MSETKQRIVIVGTGVGGVTMAARMASQGHDVQVFEKNDFVGGRCSLIKKDGFRFDQGPSMLLMPHVFKQTYTDLGLEYEKVLDVRKCKTNYKIHYPDNDSITLTSNLVEMKNELERIEPGSFKRYLAFIQEAQYNHDTSLDMVLTKNFKHWWDLLSLENAIAGIRMKIVYSWWDRACVYFKSDKLKKAFTFQSMYMGMSPYDAPGAYTLLAYTEAADGIHYPIGGFNKVCSTLEDIAKERGATFTYNAGVKSIDVDQITGLASGVTLENGEKIEADIVICNQDLVTAYNTLLPPTRYARTLQTKNQTCSTVSFYWGLNKKLPEDNFHAHNVFMANEYKPSFDCIFKDFTLPDSPSFYIHIPSRIDPSAAPEGCETIAVLVPTGVITETTSPQEIKAIHARARASVIAAIQSRIPNCTDFESWIASETVNTPYEWQEKFSLWKGSALGLSHEIMQVVYMRPQMRHEKYGNLFFVGASAQPGTGVPVVLCGAKILEKEILDIIKAGGGFKHKKVFGILGIEESISLVVLMAVLSVVVGVCAVVFNTSILVTGA
ncbi:UNVERIFIED_CONTAM: hypothetical protein HDU68_005820 [Siphonaria sp. JEL0065]|nr:hypothetical protein HDU68_005820 [Siphonaria sp. JEL0065]